MHCKSIDGLEFHQREKRCKILTRTTEDKMSSGEMHCTSAIRNGRHDTMDRDTEIRLAKRQGRKRGRRGGGWTEK